MISHIAKLIKTQKRSYSSEELVVNHYGKSIDAKKIVHDYLRKRKGEGDLKGKVTCEDLIPLDELHTNGVKANDFIFDKLFSGFPARRVCDLGCGIGIEFIYYY